MPLSVFSSKATFPDKFPKPPTLREMLEDIESMTQDDPVVTFGETLLRKGAGDSLTADEDTAAVPDIFAKDESLCDWLIDSLAVAAVRDTKPKVQFTPKSPSSLTSPSKDPLATSTSIDDPLNVHVKLKKFSTICTKSEDLLGSVELKLREMQSHCHQVMDNSKN